MLRVDVHSHLILRDTFEKAGHYGPRIVPPSNGESSGLQVGDYTLRMGAMVDTLEDERLNDPVARIADMDAKNIDVMGVTISPLFYLYWAEPEIAVPFARLQNESMARFCSHSPDRLFFLATLPLQDGAQAAAEAEYAIDTLGARGINLGQTEPAFGRSLDDEMYWPLYEVLDRRRIPLFIHPYPSGMERRSVISDTPAKYHLNWIGGYIFQETVAVATMVLGGLFDTFPNLRVIVAHGGGAIPYQWGRLKYVANRLGGIKAKRPLDEYLDNFVFDSLVHDVRARRFLVDFMGPQRLVVGDNYLGWDAVDGFALVEELGLPQEQTERICGGTAAELFNLDAARIARR